jgi:ABC-2 type transport system ATP-binding protein
MDALRFKQLHKSWGGHAALSDVSFSVAEGACFGLVGANGAGKTTLLKCLLDFCAPDRGEIAILGVTHRDTASRARLAYLPERFNPPYYLTGRDFLRYMASLHRAPYTEDGARALLDELGLAAGALDKPVRAYSKGMNQKLGLAACMLAAKPLLILDEPTSGLDPLARILLKRKLKALNASGVTVFFTSHALADVAEMCGALAVIDGGRLCFTGAPSALIEQQGVAGMEEAFLSLVGGGATIAS